MKNAPWLQVHSGPWLVYFYREGCGVCQSLFPRIQEIMQVYPHVQMATINVEDEPVLAGQHLVFTVPTLVFFFEGREVRRISRFVPHELLREVLEQMPKP